MRQAVAIILLLVLMGVGAVALIPPDRHSDCTQTADPDRSIHGCTQIISRGTRESRENRVVAYHNRGYSYFRKVQFDRAIADYTQAIKLHPRFALAYNNRGLAYKQKGHRDKAIADYRKALQIDPSHQVAKRNLKRLGVATDR